MRISPLKTYNSINFTSRVVQVDRGNVSQNLQDKIDKFEKTNHQNATYIGSGTLADAYVFNGTKCVIKMSNQSEKARYVNGNFGDEAWRLDMVKKIPNTQKLIGNVRTEDGNWYLLTKLADGSTPDGHNIKWNRESLASLMNNLAKLDATNIYHGDLGQNNCLVTKDNKVKIIDFQYAEKFSYSGDEAHALNAEKYKIPYFIAPSNLQMFEEANFGYYLKSIDKKEANSLFFNYLQEKTQYHAKRARAFSKANNARPEIIEYEKLMAKYLKDPSSDIFELEAEKLEILYMHRQIAAAMDGIKPVFSIIPNYLYIIEKANNLHKKIDQLKEDTDDESLKKLYEYKAEEAEFYANQMKNELDGRYWKQSVFYWIQRNANQSPQDGSDDIQRLFIKTCDQSFEETSPLNLSRKQIKKPDNNERIMQERSISKLSEAINAINSKQINCSYKNKNYSVENFDFSEAKEDMINDLNSVIDLYNKGDYYTAQFEIMKALWNVSELINNEENIFCGSMSEIKQNIASLEQCKDIISKLTEDLYKEMLGMVSNESDYQ